MMTKATGAFVAFYACFGSDATQARFEISAQSQKTNPRRIHRIGMQKIK